MSHDYALDRLDDFVGGDLPEHERAAVQAHLDACGDCRLEAESLAALMEEVAHLPAGIAPDRDLWSGIAGRLQPRGEGGDADEGGQRKVDATVIPLFPRPQRNPRWLQAAAAVVLMAASSGVTVALLRWDRQQVAVDAPQPRPAAVSPAAGLAATPAVQQPGVQGTETVTPVAQPADARLVERARARAADPAPPVTALAAFRPAEREYQRAAGDLERLLREQRGRMAPATAAIVERNLRIIDQAIAESRAALLKDPNNRELAQSLYAVYDSKIETLQRAVTL